ncbi:Neurogenic locus notch-like protein 3 [Stylophora pistillata]|uniref:Neurogenic locus notch-like protein 3 n=2 Tax=Stylophora pistillata TaxID=50429 RepID=A0A2B4SIA6_STYPI|nr:Neurogenic locus notch-like protein 3 [Stylophora pistillata]
MEPNCVSYNFAESNDGIKECELSNSTYERNEWDLKQDSNSIYRGAMDACLNNRCMNNATCQTGFTDRGYRCVCIGGFQGEDCDEDVDECNTGENSCSEDAECINTRGSYNCTCKQGYDGDGWNCSKLASTCKDIYDKNISLNGNRDYLLHIGSEMIPVYCHMDNNGLGEHGECEGGGWTLVMKTDGTQMTFHYDSSLWSDKESFNAHDGQTGLDTLETKLPTYWSTPFSKICLGMKINTQLNFISIDMPSNSLHALIADGQYRNTSLGRYTWKKLIGSQASLQRNCNLEGFNVFGTSFGHSRTRIGILGNNEGDCGNCDSRLGFGTGGAHDNSNTCGNDAKYGGDNGDKNTKTMGYVLVL